MNYKKDMEQKTIHYVTKAFKVFAMIVIGILLFLLANYVLMRLWNWLMPELFDLPIIDYWQALGVLILAKIIFGFGGGNGHKSKNNGKKSKKHFKSSEKCSIMRRDFSEWELYDEFWAKEGEQAFKDYVDKHKNEENDL